MKKLLFPGSLYIGSDILKDFASLVSCYGKRFVFIGGERALEASKTILAVSFNGTDREYAFVSCGRISSASEAARLESLDEVQKSDVICAVGGGSCMDIAKAIAFRCDKPLIMIPTTASSDAPGTFVYLTYSDDGSRILSDTAHYKCPDMIVIDSRIISEAPARLLAAGMGDALATWYEGLACYRNPLLKSAITETALMMAQLSHTIILRDGIRAYDAVQNNMVTSQLENVIEANCFLSSIGGLNTGCACAHGLGDWLCSLPGGHSFMHGERVFIGLTVQMILENYPLDEINRIMDFGCTVGLPFCIKDIGIDDINAVADRAGRELCNDHFMVNLICDHSPESISKAIIYQQILAENARNNKR